MLLTKPTHQQEQMDNQIGRELIVMFQYLIGGPLVIWLQHLFNKLVHKPGMRIESLHKKQ